MRKKHQDLLLLQLYLLLQLQLYLLLNLLVLRLLDPLCLMGTIFVRQQLLVGYSLVAF
jgi:hypothetical protein